MSRIKTELRSTARRLGIIRLLLPLRACIYRMRGNDGYEAKFAKAVQQAVAPGDVVWDIGANLGLYTKVFLDLAGPQGKIIAFEPAPACFAAMQETFKDVPNVQLMNMAIGNEAGTVDMNLAMNPKGATHSLVSAASDETVAVAIASSDDIVAQGLAPVPNVIKIDVEGFEYEVLLGMPHLLRNRTVREVLVEIHFKLLEIKGDKHAPTQMVNMLTAEGFDVNWTDSSHIHARRPKG
jgi:FkbM family methyltransferase